MARDATNDASLVDKIEIQERAKTFGTRGVAAVRDLAPVRRSCACRGDSCRRARPAPTPTATDERVVDDIGMEILEDCTVGTTMVEGHG